MMHDVPGVALVARLRDGDGTAADELNAWFRPRLLLFVQARTGDRELAQDVAQEVLLAVIRAARAGQVRDPGSLPGYVFAVARNQLATALRQRTRAGEEPLESAAALVTAPIDIVARDERNRLYRAIDELDAVDRQILRLTLVEGDGPGEIATRLGLSHDVVRQRKSRALKKLLAKFEPMSQTAGQTRPSSRPVFGGAE